MDSPTQRRPGRRRQLINRLDAAAQDLNAVLLVLAIGLAVLDFTCFFAIEVRKAVPPHTPTESGVATQATAPIPPAPQAVSNSARNNGG